MAQSKLTVRALAFRIGWVCFALLGWECFRTYHPPFPNPLQLELTLGPGHRSAAFPLISAGRFGLAEFLVLSWDDQGQAHFKYDRWGQPAVQSDPVTLEPYSTHRLTIQFPALALQDGNFRAVSDRIRVECDGREVFAATAHPLIRNHREIYFGENPIGGTSCSPSLDGVLRDAGGLELRGYPHEYFSWSGRLKGWLTFGRWNFLLTVALSWGLGWLLANLILRWPGWPTVRSRAEAFLRRYGWFLGGAAAGAAIFSWVIMAGTGRLFYPDTFGIFYDYQARSLLAGHWDVPPEAIDAEAFVFQGRTFGYFGCFPAILRLPMVIYDLKFGSWSRIFMLGYYCAALWAAFALLVHFVRLRRGPEATPGAAITLLLTINLGGGSTLLFLASRAYVYHEAVLSSIAFGLWSLVFTAKYSEAAGWRPAVWALVLGLASVQCRPAVGLFALACLGGAAVVQAWDERKSPRPGFRREVPLALLALGSFLSFNGVSYLKFRSFSGLPLQYHVQYDATRLARLGQTNFHLSNLGFNAATYLFHSNLEWNRRFPYVVSHGEPLDDHPGAQYDISERTLGLPFSMTGLTALCLLGLGCAWFGGPSFRRMLIAILIAAGPLLAVLLTAVASSQRYTGDFVPLLVILATMGFAMVERSRHRMVTLALLWPVTLASVFITLALTLHYQGEEVWGGPDAGIRRYQSIAQRFNDYTDRITSRP